MMFAALVQWLERLWIDPLEAVWHLLTQLVPPVSQALGILALAWLGGKLLQRLVGHALRALGVDVIWEHAGGAALSERWGLPRRLSALLGIAAYWLLVSTGVLVIVDGWGWLGARRWLEGYLEQLPRLVLALALLTGGLLLAARTRLRARVWAVAYGLPAADAVARTAGAVPLLLAGLWALEVAGLPVRLPYALLWLGGGCALATAGLALGLGVQPLCRHLAAGWALRSFWREGDSLVWNGQRGRIIRLDRFGAVVHLEGGGDRYIPYAVLFEHAPPRQRGGH